MLDLSGLLSILDVLGRFGDLKLKKTYRGFYHVLQRDSASLKGLYRLTESVLYQYSNVKDKLIRAYGQPDFILTVQPEVNATAGWFKAFFPVPIHTVIIDLAIHGLWISQHVDKYYVPNDPLKRELMAYGIGESQIAVTGMPLRAGFAEVVKSDITSMRRHLSLSHDLKTVLLIGGLLGKMLDFEGVIRSIMGMRMPIQILAVFGENETARKRVIELAKEYKFPIHTYGTTSNIHELMWASDAVISKPGSVTMAEVLALGKPLVAISPRAGSAQEIRFANFVQQNEAGVWINKADELGPALSGLFGCKSTYERVSKNAHTLGHYGLTANKAIFEDVVRTLENGRERKWPRV
jgi:processive 1,2-diacylglycerol beta-glucosyltransferase